MAFQFTLEAVRRFRQSLEDLERLRLESLLANRAALLRELEQSRDASFALQQQQQRSLMASPTPASQIHFTVARLEAMASQQKLWQHQLQELQGAVAEQMARFQQERQKRGVLDSLRDSQWREYRLQQQRREQAHLDELHLLGRARARRA
jgi:flagellar export protein FliJ